MIYNIIIKLNMIANIWELDELPFLKQSRFKHKKRDPQLLRNLRCLSYQQSHIFSKIFIFQYQSRNANTKSKQIDQFVVTSEKQIYHLKDFYQIINTTLLNQNQFNIEVAKIKKFQQQCANFIKRQVFQKCEIDYQKKQFLSFGIYLQKLHPSSLNVPPTVKTHSNQIQYLAKMNKFFIKCSINNFDFKPNMQTSNKKQTDSPQAYQIVQPELINLLIKNYIELQSFHLNYDEAPLLKYVKTFETYFYYLDEEHLKLQVFCNYSLLRFKNYIPVQFNDAITKERLSGVIFSNSDQDCMYAHFTGYNPGTILQLQGSNCEHCRLFIQHVQQNPLLTNLRDHMCNPMKYDILYCPQFNRFKLIYPKKSKRTIKMEEQKIVQESPQLQQIQPLPQAITQITYLNYIHLRQNIKKITTKKRNKLFGSGEEIFSLSFQFNNNKYVIIDPARGRNCLHCEYTDLRMYYLSKVQLNTYKCPIKGCGQLVRDVDLLYLKQVEIVQKFLKYKTQKFPELKHSGYLHINHVLRRSCIQFKKYLEVKQEEHSKQIIKQLVELKQFYETLLDPYISFKQYTLGIPDKYQKKLKQRMSNFQNYQDYEEQFENMNIREMGNNEPAIEEQEDDDDDY